MTTLMHEFTLFLLLFHCILARTLHYEKATIYNSVNGSIDFWLEICNLTYEDIQASW